MGLFDEDLLLVCFCLDQVEVELDKILFYWFCFQTPRTKTTARKPRHRATSIEGTFRGPSSYLPNLQSEHEAKYDACRKEKTLKPNVVLDWGVLTRYGLVTQFNHFFVDRA